MQRTTLGPFQAVAWRFVVDCDDDDTARFLSHVLSPLRAADADADAGPAVTARYDLRSARGQALGRLTLDGAVVVDRQSDALLCATLLWHVNRGVVDASTDHVLLHAAAAAEGGHAVLLPAPMESGKTTLVAGLVRSGLDYLTDETVALRPDGTIDAYPKALSVDEGSWQVLAELRPDPVRTPDRLTGAQWNVPPDELRPGCAVRTARPRLVVLPRYVAGSATELTPVTRAEALVEVLGQVFVPDRDRARDLRVLAEVLRSCECYRLVSGDLDGAVAAVRTALTRALRSPTRVDGARASSA